MSDSPQVFERSIKSQLTEIGVLAEAFEEWAGGLDLPFKLIMEANLMLDELITNIVVHGYQNKDDQAIMVRIQVDSAGLQIQLIDDAPPFNLLDVQSADVAADIDDREIGGLGIHFVRTLANSVEYARVATQNIVTIRKSLAAAAAQ